MKNACSLLRPPFKSTSKKKEPEKKDKPINPKDLKFFHGMCEGNKKFIPNPPSDYYCSIMKSFEKRKLGSSSSDVPQLGAQKKQSIELLVVLNEEQQGLLTFLKSSKLTPVEITVSTTEFSVAPVVRRKFEEGKSLVPPEIVPMLPTQMRRLHDCYMKAMIDVNFMKGAKFTDDNFLRGEGVI